MCLANRELPHLQEAIEQCSTPTKTAKKHRVSGEAPTHKKFLFQNVRDHSEHWEEAGSTETVVEWIETGVRVPWEDEPPPPFHNGVSLQERTPGQQEFWVKEKQRLIDCGAWEVGVDRRYVTKAFLVPKPGTNKWRLVVDLRHLNSFVQSRTTKFETLKHLRRLAKKNDWMFSFDLEDGYYAVALHPEDRKFFTVEVDGELFQFVGLPMGWNLSPYIFVKTMRTLVQEMRSPDAPLTSTIRRGRKRRGILLSKKRGMRVLPYMDDFLVLARNRREALRFRAQVTEILDGLGLRRNVNKGHWEVAQRVEHLGLEVDTAVGVFRVTETRLAKIQSVARKIITESKRRGRLIPARRLAQFTGLAQSVYLAVAPARFYLRELHYVTSSRTGWSSLVRISKQAYRDLEWWVKVPHKWNGRAIWRAPDTAILHCDASKTAWGGVLNEELPARAFWSAAERRLHITHLELQAVYNSVRSFLPWLKNRNVLLREDNMAVVHILTNHTSRSRPLMALLRQLWFLCDVNNIDIRPQYIRSAANVWADALSRDLDLDDWKLNPVEFQRKHKTWGPYEVDRFASQTSRQLKRYYSQYRDPECEGTHSLAHDWTLEPGRHNWVNPPWGLLPEVAQKLSECGAPATVVAPYWPACSWFTELWNLASEVEIVPPRRDFFLPTRLGASAPLGPAKWSAIFFRIPGRAQATTPN